MKKILKKIFLKFFCNIFVPVKMGKGSFIRGHRLIHGHKYINIGNNVKIYPYSRIECYDNYGKKYNPSIIIHDNVMINRYCTLLSAAKLEIGENTVFASHVFVSNENHGIDINGVPFLNQPLDVKDVIIGKNCWIGEKSIILPGVTIGDNVVVGAGSVVTHNLPSNVIACGSPARIIKEWSIEEKKWKKV